MAEALRLAADLPSRTWPNPPVGAVVVLDGEIVGRGRHLGPGHDHAEAVALDDAGDSARGATLYVTLEPCNHQGRTPACAPRVVDSGIKRVVVGVRDPNPNVAGGGLELINAAGIDTTVGVRGAECLDLIWPFVVTSAFSRPFVLLKTATSLDGRFAPPRDLDSAGKPFYLTGEAAQIEVHRLRRWCDAVLVGRVTVAADNPRLDGRFAGPDCPREDPRPACADTTLRAAAGWDRPGALVFAGPETGAASGTGSAAKAMEIVNCELRDGSVDPADLLRRAGDLGISVLMVEGGPTLAASFLGAGLVDRWVNFTAPVFLGGGPSWPVGNGPGDGFRRFGPTRSHTYGNDTAMVWDRTPFADSLARLTMAEDETPAGTEA